MQVRHASLVPSSCNSASLSPHAGAAPGNFPGAASHAGRPSNAGTRTGSSSSRSPAGAGTASSGRAAELCAAAERGNAAMLRALLQAGVPADVRGSQGATPLLLAAGAGRAEVVQVRRSTGGTRTEEGLRFCLRLALETRVGSS